MNSIIKSITSKQKILSRTRVLPKIKKPNDLPAIAGRVPGSTRLVVQGLYIQTANIGRILENLRSLHACSHTHGRQQRFPNLWLHSGSPARDTTSIIRVHSKTTQLTDSRCSHRRPFALQTDQTVSHGFISRATAESCSYPGRQGSKSKKKINFLA